MKRENDVPMPEPLRKALGEVEPDKQRGLERIWSRLPDEDADVHPNVDAAFDDVTGRIERSHYAASSGHRRATDRPARRARPRRLGVAVAATLLVIFIAAGLWVINRPAVFETAAAEQRTVQLPDGSAVELNSETILRVASGFDNTLFGQSSSRRVNLQGEAFFTVAENPRPFIVETSDAVVRVTGTEFNVRARAGRADPGTRVTLVEGAVIVENRDAEDEAVTLDAPGAVAQVGASPGTISPSSTEADLDYVLAWRRQGFAFIDTPVDVILDELERRFAVRIYPRAGADLAESMNLIYSRGVTPEEVLTDICVAQSCTYRETSRGYALTPPSRP